MLRLVGFSAPYTLVVTPEPATFLLIGAGLLLMWYTRMGRLRNARGDPAGDR